MARRIKLLTIILFAAVLITPFVQECLGVFHYEAIKENRIRKSRPKLSAEMLEPGNPFAQRYEEYFNDSYGFRDLLIRCKNQIDYSLFGKSDQILIGKENWLFYRSELEQEIFSEQDAPENFSRLFDILLRLNRDLKARGIILVMLPVPMKNSLYPEMLPSSVPVRPQPTAFQKYRKFLREHPEIATLDAQSIMLELKKSFPVFHKADFHWNDVTGFYVGRELVNLLARLNGLPSPWKLEVEVKKEWSVGRQGETMALLRPPRVEELFIANLNRHLGTEGWTWTQDPNRSTYHSPQPAEGILPKTALVGDSFSDALVRSDCFIYFSHLERFYNYNFNTCYREIPAGTRFVIFQHLESILHSMLQENFWPPEVRPADRAGTSGPSQTAQGRAQSGASGVFRATPGPIRVCDGSGLGVTTLSWEVENCTNVEVRVNTPDGLLLTYAGPAGSAVTGKWVGNGTKFYLQDVSANRARITANTIASLSVAVTTQGCP